jgi:hypothetical protein
MARACAVDGEENCEKSNADAVEIGRGVSSQLDASLNPNSLEAKENVALEANKTFISASTNSSVSHLMRNQSYQADPFYYRAMFDKTIQEALKDMSITSGRRYHIYNTTFVDQSRFIIFTLAKLIDFRNLLAPRIFAHEIFPARWARFEQGADGRIDQVWVYWSGRWEVFSANCALVSE